MIIATLEDFEIGKVITGTYRLNQENEEVECHIYIMRVATKEEWLEYRREQGRELDIEVNPNARYYLVSID